MGPLVIRKASLTSRKLAKLAAGFAADKKAQDIVVLDMRNLVNFCDYFVICSGTSGRHAQSVAEHIEDSLGQAGVHVRHTQRLKAAEWFVFDLGDIVIHVFEKDAREFYGLEYLWREAKKVKISEQLQ